MHARASSGGSFRPLLRQGERFDPDAARRPLLVFEDVHKAYRADAPVLRGLNLRIERGEFVFFTGPSGAGKSTLLRLLYAAESVDSGRILFMGRDVGRLRPESVPYLRRNIGVVFQDFKLIGTWNVTQNVALPLEVLGLPQRLIRTRVGEALERVGLGGRGADLSATLSGGEQQRVAIARAIVCEPALVLADEPTGNLDPQLAIDVLGLFEDIHETGVTVLFATHDRSLLDVRPRRVVVLDGGKAMDAPNGLGDAADACTVLGWIFGGQYDSHRSWSIPTFAILGGCAGALFGWTAGLAITQFFDDTTFFYASDKIYTPGLIFAMNVYNNRF